LNDIAIIYFHADLCEYLHGILFDMLHSRIILVITLYFDDLMFDTNEF
jgi:hypothetical protein